MAKRNYKKDEDVKSTSRDTKSGKSRRSGSKPRKGGYDKRKDSKQEDKEELRNVGQLIPMKNGDHNPNWYFTDKAMAEQVTQLAFQNLAGHSIIMDGQEIEVPNVNTVFLNPAPGVIDSADYGSIMLNKTAGINLAGFRFFSELAAYTGRSAIYGPQDISTMILGLGEVLSIMEVIRRMFGVAFTMNMRNRSYPREILKAMYVDADDLFAHFSDYRTRYNTLVTMINQIPIPESVAYFDKCQKIYEEIYLDCDSAMAQTLIIMPFTTWILDETSYSGGTILHTIPVCAQANCEDPLTAVQPMSYFLNIADSLIGALLNSSTLNVVYTDILNLASKKGVNFLKMDYLAEGYAVVPRFSKEFSLQMHNSTIIGPAILPSFINNPVNATPLNDVYPNASTNSLFYNPGFGLYNISPTNIFRTGKQVLVDMPTDAPDVVDRIECLRFASIAARNVFTTGGRYYVCDAVVPDHYIVGVKFWTAKSLFTDDYQNSTIGHSATIASWDRLATLAANIDWAPRFFNFDANTGLITSVYTGDVNFYTVVEEDWLRKVNQFVALSLYQVR